MTVTANTTFQLFWRDRAVAPEFRSGVSLHSHTMYSEESLDMVPRYTAKVPYLGSAIRRQQAEYSRRRNTAFDFGNAFWTPPLAPRQAYRVEEKQIQRQFDLPALVSLTDHDDIRAGTHLRMLDRFRKAPVSTEWTIPYGPTFFHLGVHNMPAPESAALMREMEDFSAHPDEARLAELLEMFDSYPDILLVLNHPLWDEKGISSEAHAEVTGRLLARYGHWFHALELNGLRSWHENREVIALSRRVGLPLVAGGDRHGREPNAILNLSKASSFAGFVNEIRREHVSHVTFMPQYHEPLKLRVLQTMIDVVRDYPENFEGRRSWRDRVFYRDPQTKAVTPLGTIWNDGGPLVVRNFIAAMLLLEWRGVRSALRLALDDRSTVWSDPEAAI